MLDSFNRKVFILHDSCLSSRLGAYYFWVVYSELVRMGKNGRKRTKFVPLPLKQAEPNLRNELRLPFEINGIRVKPLFSQDDITRIILSLAGFEKETRPGVNSLFVDILHAPVLHNECFDFEDECSCGTCYECCPDYYSDEENEPKCRKNCTCIDCKDRDRELYNLEKLYKEQATSYSPELPFLPSDSSDRW